jgi:hypothetical protein
VADQGGPVPLNTILGGPALLESGQPTPPGAATDSRIFVYNLFSRATTLAVNSPVLPRASTRSRSTSAEPTRRSLRQAAAKSSIPVAQRTTSRLIRELDLVGPSKKVSDVAQENYATLFQGPLTPKSIVMLRAATRLGDVEVAKAASALASEELAAQVESAAA